MISFDFLLQKLGSIGLAQMVALFMLSYGDIIAGFNFLATVFIAYAPKSRCNVPPLDNQTAFPNLNETTILNLTTPDGSTCKRYGYNLTTCDQSLSCVNTSADAIPCDQGYYYDRSIFTQTVITEFDLICDRSFLNPLSTSMYYVGVVLGSLVFGNFCDKFGRKITLLVCHICTLGSMMGLAFSTSVEMYIVFRAIVAAFTYGITIGTFVYIMEIFGKEWRTMAGMVYQIFFAIGYMILGGLSYQWRDWHALTIASAVATLPFLVFALVLPESPRWLLTKGRDKEGKKVVELMAKLNKVNITESDFDEAKKVGEEKALSEDTSRVYTTLDLYRTTGMRIISLKVLFSWFVSSFVYYGISLNAGSLAGDIFVNNTLNGVFEIFSYVFCILVMDRVGRRLLLAAMFLVAGLGLIASAVVNVYAGEDQGLITLGVVFAFIAKFGISGSFGIIYNFTSELYPTVVRSNSVGNASLGARVGGILAPYVITLQDVTSWLPGAIFGGFAIFAGVLSLTLPETNGQPMIETIEQAEHFYKTGIVVLEDKATKENVYGNQNQAFEEDLNVASKL